MRRMAVLVSATILVAAGCTEAFDPPPGTTPEAPSASPAATEPAGLPEPVASPVIMEVAALPEEGDVEIPVRVLGWIEPGGSVLCGTATCFIDLHDPRDPLAWVSLEVATDATGRPGTMVHLGSGFEDADLRVTAEDGSVLRSGDYAWVTGTWKSDGDTLVANSIERGAAPRMTAVDSTIPRLASRKVGTLVKVTGKLGAPFLLSCYGGTCNLYVEDSSGRSLRIEVRLGRRGELRPATMWPLKDKFKAADLRVIDSRGATARAGDRVVVEGWLRKTGDGTPYLDPVLKITRRGS